MKIHSSTFQVIISFVLAIFLLVSCNSIKPVDEMPSNDIMEHSSIDYLRMFFEKLHPNDQRSIFNGLPSETKYALFNNHWQTQLNMADNQKEKEFIQDLINHLKPAYYADTELFNSEGAEFFSRQFEVGLTVYQNDPSRVSSILNEIGGDSQAEILIAAEEQQDCECNVVDGWCVFGKCAFFDDCKVTLTGCGNGWLWPCDGMCLSSDDATKMTQEK
ncbi:MAG: bacteriocin fulvocin C-related protein [Candidatus Scalindua sp.]|nr:bacteriocin fulvocin C-related protein [Candidatus Scalindua sp.]